MSPPAASAVDLVRSLYAYDRWVMGLLLDAAENVPDAGRREQFGASFDSIHGTFAHVLGAQIIWLSRWRGETPSRLLGGADFADLAAIRARWEQQWREVDAFLDVITADALAAMHLNTNTRGERFRLPLWQMMVHVVNHGTHHRAELCDMLTRLGQPPPQTDLIAYYRREAGPAD